jgi:hypothetical protein
MISSISALANHGDARPNRDPSALSAIDAILVAPQAGPRPTIGCYHVSATLSRRASTVDTAIKSS